jgi:hypothetical protein
VWNPFPFPEPILRFASTAARKEAAVSQRFQNETLIEKSVSTSGAFLK